MPAGKSKFNNMPWDDYENPHLARKLTAAIKDITPPGMKLMEVCGTHTMNISRYGLRRLFGNNPLFVSGPGCPVCVTGQSDVESYMELACREEVILVTFGDMLKVSGSNGSLTDARARGADIRVVYSPFEAVRVAAGNRGREVVFLAVGFETTIPVVLLSLKEAIKRELYNFSLFVLHKKAVRAVHHLLESGSVSLDGFLLPGHVSAITGRRAWDFVSRDYGLPAVVTGFTINDILAAVYRLAHAARNGKAAVFNEYQRVVKEECNPTARALADEYLEEGPAVWRGMGEIPASGLYLRENYACFDARKRFSLPPPGTVREPDGCICGEILKGNYSPFDCILFAEKCRPEHPVGPCMVSSEGACAAYYHYERST